jgi:hypothetical protein
MTRHHAHRARARAQHAWLAGCVALLTAALAVTGYSGAWAAFTATTTSTGNQLTTKVTFPDYRTAVTESGPVVHHPFDDLYASRTAAVVAGAGTAGTYNGGGVASSVNSGAISASAGGPRRAVNFPSNTYAVANSTSTFSGAPLKLTLEAWVRTGRGGAVVGVLPDDSTTTAGRTQLYVSAVGEVCVGLTLQAAALQAVCGSDSTDKKVWTASDQASPVWHHIAAVIDPALTNSKGSCSNDGAQVSVYVDGAVQYDANFCGGTWPSAVTGRVRAGSAPVTAGSAPSAWSGDIDEMAVYGRALNADEVRKHYDLGNGTPEVTGNYATSVNANTPERYWQLEDTPALGVRTVADASGSAGRGGTYHSAFDREVVGASTGTSTPGKAVQLNGLSDISTGASRTTPTAFSTEVWFKSTEGTGPLVSFGATPTGPSTVPDAAVYLTATGRLAFSIRASQRTVVHAPKDYRNTGWHLVTATMGAGGAMRLYVDGTLVAEDTASTTTTTLTGFWRWGGGGDYSSFATPPGAAFFTGLLDEASVYDKELTAEEVAVHWGATF